MRHVDRASSPSPAVPAPLESPSHATSTELPRTTGKTHWTVRTNYRLRTASFFLTFVFVTMHTWGQARGPLFWTLLSLQLLVYPHLAYLRARHSSRSQEAEVQNLIVDAVLFGALVAFLDFPVAITFTVFIACTVNVTITRGARGALLTICAFVAGAAATGLVRGWHFSPDSNLPTTLFCLVSNAGYMVSIGLAAYGRNGQLRKTREALRSGEQQLKQQLAEIQQLQEQLKEQALRDPLTGLYNRRALDSLGDRELARCRRLGQPLVVMMIDVDHFKKVNDTYGHPGGDEVLKALGKLLLGNVRVTDVVCRYGGEEFFVLLPGMPCEVATDRAERWRQAFGDLVTVLGDARIQATISTGIALYPDHGDTLPALIHCADTALYQAKSEGRNRYIVHSGDRGDPR